MKPARYELLWNGAYPTLFPQTLPWLEFHAPGGRLAFHLATFTGVTDFATHWNVISWDGDDPEYGPTPTSYGVDFPPSTPNDKQNLIEELCARHYDLDVLTATLTGAQIRVLMSRAEDWVRDMMGPWRDALPNGLTHEKREDGRVDRKRELQRFLREELPAWQSLLPVH